MKKTAHLSWSRRDQFLNQGCARGSYVLSFSARWPCIQGRYGGIEVNLLQKQIVLARRDEQMTLRCATGSANYLDRRPWEGKAFSQNILNNWWRPKMGMIFSWSGVNRSDPLWWKFKRPTTFDVESQATSAKFSLVESDWKDDSGLVSQKGQVLLILIQPGCLIVVPGHQTFWL